MNSLMLKKMTQCEHKNAVSIRGGMVRAERLFNYESAWCPDCGAFRESAAYTTAEPWLIIGTDVSELPDRDMEVKIKPRKKAKRKKKKK